MMRLSLERLLLLGILVALTAAAIFGPDGRPASLPRTARAGERTIQGKGIAWWANHAVQARKDANARARTIRRLRRAVHTSTTIEDAIRLAAVVYHVDPRMLERKASCESTGGHGYNPHAIGHRQVAGERPVGLFQFLPSTWRSTPFARFSPFDPLAAALAAGWMHGPAHRGTEWACR